MRLTKLAYASNHGGVSNKSLEEILTISQANNTKDDITGVLISGQEDFMQLLEGGHTVVSKCFMRIMQDARHQDVRVLFAGTAGSRICSQWSMRLVKQSGRDKKIISQYLINEKFSPDEMSQLAIEDLCKSLSEAA